MLLVFPSCFKSDCLGTGLSECGLALHCSSCSGNFHPGRYEVLVSEFHVSCVLQSEAFNYLIDYFYHNYSSRLNKLGVWEDYFPDFEALL
jgi:hypothetical protein